MRSIFIDCGSHDGCSIRKFRDLIDKEERYEIFSFEANPKLQSHYKDLSVKHSHYNKAVWINNGNIDFHILGKFGAGTLSELKKDNLLKKNLRQKALWTDFSLNWSRDENLLNVLYQRWIRVSKSFSPDGDIIPNWMSYRDSVLRQLSLARIGSETNLETVQVESVDLSEWIKNNFKKEDYIILKLDVEGAEYEILEKFFDVGAIEYINEVFIEFHNERCGKAEEDDLLLINRIEKEGIKCDTSWDAMHPPYLIESECEEEISIPFDSPDVEIPIEKVLKRLK
tara:strand:+ start:317 stop:1165 length:849 start_codon:yes stop_codon:yes gene_type:complete